MGITILKNDWVMKSETLSDGSKVFNLENKSIPGTLVLIGCVDEGRANLLQMALGEYSSFIAVDEVKLSKPSLLDAGEGYVNAAAALAGCATKAIDAMSGCQATPEFRNTLREIPMLAKPFSVGDMARAYLAKKMAELTITTKL